jgi:hypothetical protein
MWLTSHFKKYSLYFHGKIYHVKSNCYLINETFNCFRFLIQTYSIDLINRLIFVSGDSSTAPQNPKNDGKQTPMRGHPVFVAQHATATCCRGCIQKWHGIKKGKVLNDQEIELLVGLAMAWIEGRLGCT